MFIFIKPIHMFKNTEFAEIIYRESDSVQCINCKYQHGLDTMVNLLKTHLTNNHILVLDLHNVTDLFDTHVHLSDNQICVLSFVGRASETRNTARKDVIQRITNNQITIGILMFERPKQKYIDKSTSIDDTHSYGTKAWHISIMNDCLENKCFYFVDDSEDHINLAVKHLGNKGNVFCYLVDGTREHAIKSINEINKIIYDLDTR